MRQPRHGGIDSFRQQSTATDSRRQASYPGGLEPFVAEIAIKNETDRPIELDLGERETPRARATVRFHCSVRRSLAQALSIAHILYQQKDVPWKDEGNTVLVIPAKDSVSFHFDISKHLSRAINRFGCSDSFPPSISFRISANHWMSRVGEARYRGRVESAAVKVDLPVRKRRRA